MDILTGFMIWAAEALTLAVLLWSRWFYERDDFYLSWGLGFALHGIGVALVALRGEIPDVLSIQIANAMVLSGIGLWAAGLLQFDRKPVDAYVAIPALIWVAGMFLTPVRESFANRTALANIASMAGYGIMVAILLRHSGPSQKTRRFMAGFMAVQLVMSGITAVVAVLHQTESFDTSPQVAWLFFPAAFCFIAGIMSGAKLLTERSEEKLRNLALTDPLTGVLNRRGLIAEFDRLRQADRPDKPLIAFLHFDLDSFKQINDRCGHQGGDAVLVAFAWIGQTSLRGRGSFGRMGGEEFASILRVADMVEAASVAEAIRLTLKQQTITAGAQTIQVTVSAGISLATAASADLDLLLGSADRALYHAKESGRDRTAIGSEPDLTIVPAFDRDEDIAIRADKNADDQVATLQRIAAIGRR